MPSEMEFVNYKEFVESLPETESLDSADKTVISNPTNGPRAVPGSAKDRTTTATEADLVASNYLSLDGSTGLKRLPGNLVAPKSSVTIGNGKTPKDAISCGTDTEFTGVITDENGTIIVGIRENGNVEFYGRVVFNGNEKAFYTPQEFGAIADGVTDCSDAFSRALSYLQTIGGGILFCPSGKYVFEKEVRISPNIPYPGENHLYPVIIEGVPCPSYNPAITKTPQGTEFICKSDDPIFRTNYSFTNNKLRYSTANSWMFSGVSFVGDNNYQSTAIHAQWTRLKIFNCQFVNMYNCILCPHKMIGDGTEDENYCDFWVIRNVGIKNLRNIGIQMEQCDSADVCGLYIENLNGNYAIEARECAAMTVKDVNVTAKNATTKEVSMLLFSNCNGLVLQSIRCEYVKGYTCFVSLSRCYGAIVSGFEIRFDISKNVFLAWESKCKISNGWISGDHLQDNTYDIRLIDSECITENIFAKDREIKIH